MMPYWLTALLLLSTGAAHAQERYEVSWDGRGIGSAQVTLTPLAEAGCFRYETQTRPMAMVRWLYGSPRETAEFCLVKGEPQPRHYEYFNDKRKKDNYSLDFDWSARKVKSIKGGEVTLRDLPERAYDPLTLRQALRYWLAGPGNEAEREFVFVDDDRVRPYRFARKGRETLDNGLSAQRVERVDDPNKTLRVWFAEHAPGQGLSLIRLENVKDGEVKLRLQLQ